MKKNNVNIKTTEEDTSSKNDKNNPSFFFDPENNPLHKAVIEGIAGVSNIYFETADKAVFEIIRGWYPDISLKEILVCWQAYWAESDHGFPAYDEVIARLEKSKADEIPEDLRKRVSPC